MTDNSNEHRWSELLGPRLRGQLSPADAVELDKHLQTCPDCRQEVAALRLLTATESASLTRRERRELHRGVHQRTVTARVPAGRPSTVPWFARLAPALGAAGLVVLVVAGGIYLVSGSDGELEGADDGATTDSLAPEVSGPALRDADEDSGAGGGEEKKRSKNRMAYLGSKESSDPDRRAEDPAEDTRGTGGAASSAGNADAPSKASSKTKNQNQQDEDDEGTEEGPAGEPAPAAPREAAAILIDPESSEGPVGSCSAFTIRLSDKKGRGVAGATVDLEQRHELADDGLADNEPVVSFCLPSQGPNATDVDESGGDLDPEEENPDNAGTSGGEAFATTNSKGELTVGITVQGANGSDGSGSVTLTAFFEGGADDDDPGGDDPVDSSSQQWTVSESRQAYRGWLGSRFGILPPRLED